MPDRRIGHRFDDLHGGPTPDPKERRARLAAAVMELARQLDAGTVPPIVYELRIIIGLCEGQGLWIEARRIRRWIGDPE